ncbi:MAG: DUF86 domain-containing protein [Planctomycetes bacterium]|nr:DUF86 domain-containing protein [Planctomycetota bacterium]
MQPESKSLLHDVVRSIQSIRTFVHGRTFEQYKEDELLRSAVERKLEIIGEALNLLHKREPEVASALPDHRAAISFRNILIHGYSRVDHAIVWTVVTGRLEPLERAAKALLEAPEP